ncbi:MAG: spherulation-specific family 4 protein, partial [bacterium]
IFIDETSITSYSYYENLYNYIKARENRIVILNPGTTVSNSYFNIADKIIVIENTFDSLTNYTYSYTGINGYKACAIIYNIPTPSDAYYTKNYLVKDLNIKCLYLTANNPQTALFSMPTYFNIT